jgi:hypothetical protein
MDRALGSALRFEIPWSEADGRLGPHRVGTSRSTALRPPPAPPGQLLPVTALTQHP